MDYEVNEKCSRRLGPPGCGGDWSEDGATSHAVEGRRTLCGRVIGSESNGWLRVHPGYRPVVTCLRCLKSPQLRDAR